MAYKQLTISGYCGFAEKRTIQFAIPNGTPGSGLTYLVGPNNSGKSAIIESIHSMLSGVQPKIPGNSRNTATDRRVEISLIDNQGLVGGLRTRGKGGEATEWFQHQETAQSPAPVEGITNQAPHPAKYYERIFVLPSRRYFPAVFGDSDGIERGRYMLQFPFPMQRTYGMQGFFQRLARIQNNRNAFDSVLREIITPVPRWHIEQERGGNNQSYISVNVPNGTHDTDGLGEGILSLLLIIDSLYDSKKDQMIVIDEPELSLHPALQRKLARLFVKYAADRQIVIATHSPYFLDWQSLFSGASLFRVVNRDGGTQIYTLTNNTIESLRGITRDLNNPHVLGLEAREAFFKDEPLVLVEGQDDVMLYPKIADDNKIDIGAEFFGWGTGGANKMQIFARMLEELGYQRVAGILDADKRDEVDRLFKEFPKYYFAAIPANDVRTKLERTIKPVTGLLDEDYKLRDQYRNDTLTILNAVSNYVRVGR